IVVAREALTAGAQLEQQLMRAAAHAERNVVVQAAGERLLRRAARRARRLVIKIRKAGVGLERPPRREEDAESRAEAPAVLHVPCFVGARELAEAADLDAAGLLRGD